MRFNPRAIARRGHEIFERRRATLERRHRGEYVLIDINTEKLFVASSPEAVYRKAVEKHERGPFHLIRIGHRAAFRSRRILNVYDPRITR